MRAAWVVLMGLGLVQGVAFGERPISDGKVRCRATTIEPAGANFFTSGFRPPAGDTIDLDLTQKEITQLKFASGNELPLARVGARLVDPSVGTGHPDRYYEGAGRTRQFRYEGLLMLYCNAESCAGNLQVLGKGQLVPWALHTMGLECLPLR